MGGSGSLPRVRGSWRCIFGSYTQLYQFSGVSVHIKGLRNRRICFYFLLRHKARFMFPNSAAIHVL